MTLQITSEIQTWYDQIKGDYFLVRLAYDSYKQEDANKYAERFFKSKNISK